MSEYPLNSTARVYRDIGGNPVTLRQLIRLEPEWAHTRIKQCEEAEAKLAEALEENQKLNDDIDNICAALGQVAEDAKGCYHIALGIMTAHKRKPEGDGG